MANTVTVDTKTIQLILSRIDNLAKEVKKLSKRLPEKKPGYDSDEKWLMEIKEGEEDFKAGRYTTIKNKKELKEFFDNL